MAASDIEWTEATWNQSPDVPFSPGCTNCYAMRMAARLQAMGMVNMPVPRANRASAMFGPAE